MKLRIVVGKVCGVRKQKKLEVVHRVVGRARGANGETVWDYTLIYTRPPEIQGFPCVL